MKIGKHKIFPCLYPNSNQLIINIKVPLISPENYSLVTSFFYSNNDVVKIRKHKHTPFYSYKKNNNNSTPALFIDLYVLLVVLFWSAFPNNLKFE